MEQIKTLTYRWPQGSTEVLLDVGSYHYGSDLFIRLYQKTRRGWAFFATLTENPERPLKENEAFVDSFQRDAKMAFIIKHGLGKALPEGYHLRGETYQAVAFDLDRLAEFDRDGVERFRKQYQQNMELQKEYARKEQER
ncbi:MAG: DUF4313 domain-containing protein [Blautia sp.]